MRPLLLSLVPAVAWLAGCGADVASSAATVGKLQAQQVEQAKSQQDALKNNLGTAMQAADPAARPGGDK